MTPEELRRELVILGIPCRVHREEVFVETCWFCENSRWNLQLDPTNGRFLCWACGAGKGQRLATVLEEKLGRHVELPYRRKINRGSTTVRPLTSIPFAHIPITESPVAERYLLLRRGITPTVARLYNLVVCTDQQHLLNGRIVIPVLDFWTGALFGHIGRTFTNQRPKYLSTLAHKIPAGYRVRDQNTPCVLVEGFFDAIAVHRAGYHVAVLSGTSAPWAVTFAARWGTHTPLIIMLDGEAGVEAARLRWGLTPVAGAAVQLLSLPKGRDPADFAPTVLHRLITKKLMTSIVPQ